MIVDFSLAKYGICEGYAMVCDMKGQTFSHMAKTNFIIVKKFMKYVQVFIRCLFLLQSEMDIFNE